MRSTDIPHLAPAPVTRAGRAAQSDGASDSGDPIEEKSDRIRKNHPRILTAASHADGTFGMELGTLLLVDLISVNHSTELGSRRQWGFAGVTNAQFFFNSLSPSNPVRLAVASQEEMGARVGSRVRGGLGQRDS